MLLQLVRLRSGVWIGVASAVVGLGVLVVAAFGTSTRRLAIGRRASGRATATGNISRDALRDNLLMRAA